MGFEVGRLKEREKYKKRDRLLVERSWKNNVETKEKNEEVVKSIFNLLKCKIRASSH